MPLFPAPSGAAGTPLVGTSGGESRPGNSAPALAPVVRGMEKSGFWSGVGVVSGRVPVPPEPNARNATGVNPRDSMLHRRRHFCIHHRAHQGMACGVAKPNRGYKWGCKPPSIFQEPSIYAGYRPTFNRPQLHHIQGLGNSPGPFFLSEIPAPCGVQATCAAGGHQPKRLKSATFSARAVSILRLACG